MCDVLTRPALCDVTRPVLCDLEVTRFGCPLPTRACGGEWGRPGDWGGFRNPGGYGSGDESGYTEGISDFEGVADDSYWSGYLAALEEVEALDAGTDTSGSPGGG